MVCLAIASLVSFQLIHTNSPLEKKYTPTVEWLNAAAEALGREGVEVSPFDFRHGGGDTTVGLQLRDAPVPLIYLRIALIQVRFLAPFGLLHVFPCPIKSNTDR